MSKMIRQREIAPEQMQKVLEEGKSDLLRGFISKKGKRFDAVLTLTSGKLGGHLRTAKLGSGKRNWKRERILRQLPACAAVRREK